MKKSLILILLLLILFTGCSDIKYPPRGATIVDNNRQTVTAEDNTESLDKYNLQKFDIAEKEFLWSTDNLTPNNGIITVDVDFTSSQHYSVSAVGTVLGVEGAVVSLSSGDEVFGAFYFNRDLEASEALESPESPESGGSSLKPIYFPEGAAQLTLTVLRGEVNINSITVVNTSAISNDRYDISVALNHITPSEEAAAVFKYLNSQFGGRVLTSQHCTVNTNAEIDIVYEITGRYPAVRFGDADGFFDYTDSADNRIPREVILSQEWWEKGGIPAFTWMWRSPSDNGIYADKTDFMLSEAVANAKESGVAQMDTDYIANMVESGEISVLCMQTISDIDKVAAALTLLADDGVPVLFNPIPDGGSRLYWWSTDGGDYVRLWNLLYDRLINYHGLNNLIWIWSGGNHLYYPGDNRVDIIGESVFTVGSREIMGSQAVKMGYTEDYNAPSTMKKPAMITASSGLPSPDVLARDKAAWSVWSLYKGDFVSDEQGVVRARVKTMLNKFYNHKLTICLDGLEKWS